MLMVSILQLKNTVWQIELKKKQKKQDPTVCCLQEMHHTGKDKHKPKVKG
jgi:hypothetical protein